MTMIRLSGDELVAARAAIRAHKLRGEAESEAEYGLEPSEAALTASAKAVLIRAGIHEPNAEQLESARESARLIYRATAEQAIKTGTVRP